MDETEQYILKELAYSAERSTWFELNGQYAITLQDILTRKDAEIDRLREQLKYSNEFREIMNEERCDALEENEQLRNGLEHIVEIYDHHVKTYDHVPSNVYLMAKIARDALKEKE